MVVGTSGSASERLRPGGGERVELVLGHTSDCTVVIGEK